MAIAFVQSLLQGSSKTSGTSLVLSGSKTLTVGNTVYVAFAMPGGTGTVSCADNLGNTYTPSVRIDASLNVSAMIYRCDVTTGGTLTSQTVTHPSSTPRAAISTEFSGVGTTNNTDSAAGSGTLITAYPGSPPASIAQIVGNLWVGVFGWQGPVTDGFSVDTAAVAALEPTVEQGTTGQSAGSNISVGFLYYINTSTDQGRLIGDLGTGRNSAGAGIDENPAAAAVSTLLWKPRLGPNYRR